MSETVNMRGATISASLVLRQGAPITPFSSNIQVFSGPQWFNPGPANPDPVATAGGPYTWIKPLSGSMVLVECWGGGAAGTGFAGGGGGGYYGGGSGSYGNGNTMGGGGGGSGYIDGTVLIGLTVAGNRQIPAFAYDPDLPTDGSSYVNHAFGGQFCNPGGDGYIVVYY